MADVTTTSTETAAEAAAPVLTKEYLIKQLPKWARKESSKPLKNFAIEVMKLMVIIKVFRPGHKKFEKDFKRTGRLLSASMARRTAVDQWYDAVEKKGSDGSRTDLWHAIQNRDVPGLLAQIQTIGPLGSADLGGFFEHIRAHHDNPDSILAKIWGKIDKISNLAAVCKSGINESMQAAIMKEANRLGSGDFSAIGGKSPAEVGTADFVTLGQSILKDASADDTASVIRNFPKIAETMGGPGGMDMIKNMVAETVGVDPKDLGSMGLDLETMDFDVLADAMAGITAENNDDLSAENIRLDAFAAENLGALLEAAQEEDAATEDAAATQNEKA